MRKKQIFAVCMMLLFSAAGFTQSSNATVGGTVNDAAGAVIPGVDVTATNVNTGIVSNQLTNEAGSYNFASLQPGTYTLRASLPGFQAQSLQNVTLGQSQQVRLNFTLQVAGTSQTVEVVADTTSVALATTTASVGDVLPGGVITDDGDGVVRPKFTTCRMIGPTLFVIWFVSEPAPRTLKV